MSIYSKIRKKSKNKNIPKERRREYKKLYKKILEDNRDNEEIGVNDNDCIKTIEKEIEEVSKSLNRMTNIEVKRIYMDKYSNKLLVCKKFVPDVDEEEIKNFIKTLNINKFSNPETIAEEISEHFKGRVDFLKVKSIVESC